MIDVKCHWLVWPLRAFGKPEIAVNGGQLPAQWGPSTVDLPEGQHNVDVVVNYLWEYGRALTVVPVQTQQQTVLYYKPPVLPWIAGVLDTNPSGYPGMKVAIGAGVAGVLLVVIVVILALSG